ncbi:dnaJ-like protein subfamily B member 8-like isoform X2 [Senna tora]|uniref:DnaJ-like protein subfamily B member 8-like isoform X2 n=1 Tax=Senna tora TaxID=362788 RepID=A0A834TGT4_9FABA|nr:dnaJ-like protein subfamily B member 8-like isoform X2 [Senna tora]
MLSTVDHHFRSADMVFCFRSFARTLLSAFSTYSLQQWHPDKCTRTPSLQAEAKRKFQQIHEAYQAFSSI